MRDPDDYWHGHLCHNVKNAIELMTFISDERVPDDPYDWVGVRVGVNQMPQQMGGPWFNLVSIPWWR